MAMTGDTRHRQETDTRDRECWRRRIAGDTQEKIAEAVGISQQAVSKILQRVGDRYSREFVEEMRSVKAVQTARLEALYVESVAQWHRSCEDAEKTTTVSGRAVVNAALGMVDLPDLETTTVEGQSGNPALLAQARGFLADIRAIWGLDISGRLDELEALLGQAAGGEL